MYKKLRKKFLISFFSQFGLAVLSTKNAKHYFIFLHFLRLILLWFTHSLSLSHTLFHSLTRSFILSWKIHSCLVRSNKKKKKRNSVRTDGIKCGQQPLKVCNFTHRVLTNLHSCIRLSFLFHICTSLFIIFPPSLQYALTYSPSLSLSLSPHRNVNEPNRRMRR